MLGVTAGLLCLSPGGIHGQPTNLASTEKTGAVLLSPGILPQVLEEGRIARKGELSAVRSRVTQAREAYLDAQKDLQALMVTAATVKTSIIVQEMSLSQIQEQIAILSTQKSKTLRVQSDLARQIESLKQERTIVQESRAVLEKQMENLRNTVDPAAWSREMEESFHAYLRILRAIQRGLDRLLEYANKRAEIVENQVRILDDLLSQLRTVEEIRKVKFLKRESVLTAKDQVGGVWQSIEMMIDQGRQWLVTLVFSGAILRFVAGKIPLLLGLCISIVLLRWGAGKIRAVVLPRLILWQDSTTDVFLRILVEIPKVLLRFLFPVGLIFLLGIGLWGLQLWSSAPARLAMAVLATYVLLRLSFQFLHSLLAGSRDGGILPLTPDTGRYYSRGLRLLAAYGILGSLALYTAQALGFPEPTRHFMRYLFEGGLLALPLWIFRGHHLQRLLSELAGDNRGEFWSRSTKIVWGVLLFLLVAIILADLLSFHGLSVYLVHSTVTSLGVFFLTMISGLGLHKSVHYLWHPKDGYLARRSSVSGEWLTRLYDWSGKAISWLAWATAIIGGLLAWGITPTTAVGILKGLTWGIDIGQVKITPLNVGLLVLVFYGTRWVSMFVRSILETRVFPRTEWDLGIRYTITTIFQYMIVVLGILIGLSILGFPLANLALIVGALGVGVGLGLQDIVGNFVSGLVLLFERPIKVGDMLVIDGQWGEVKQIRMRSTVFQTFDRCSLIIPNSQLTSQRVLNWTHEGRGPTRLQLKVGVSYDSDVNLVTRLLLDVCAQNPRIMEDPPPQVFIQAFGESSLDFNLWFFVRTPEDRIPATHEINQAIYETFREHGIRIPFPQRDIHIRNRIEEGVEWTVDRSSRSGVELEMPARKS